MAKRKTKKETKKILDTYWDEFLRAYYHQPCSCGGHSSFWRTIITSPQWEEWKKFNNNLVWDFAESEELGIISVEHFQAFIKFISQNQKYENISIRSNKGR